MNSQDILVHPGSGVEYTLIGLFYENENGGLEGVVEIQDLIKKTESEVSEKKVVVKKPESELRPLGQGKKVKIRGLDLEKGKEKRGDSDQEKLKESDSKKVYEVTKHVQVQRYKTKDEIQRKEDEMAFKAVKFKDDFQFNQGQGNQLKLRNTPRDEEEDKKAEFPSRRSPAKIVLSKPNRKEKSKTIFHGGDTPKKGSKSANKLEKEPVPGRSPYQFRPQMVNKETSRTKAPLKAGTTRNQDRRKFSSKRELDQDE